MKLQFLFILMLVFKLAEAQSSAINICSFNIRYDNPNDGAHNWKYRKENVAALIMYHKADIIGMQEVLKNQLDDLEETAPKL